MRSGEVSFEMGSCSLWQAATKFTPGWLPQLNYLLHQKLAAECRVYTSDLKLYVPRINESMYPDVMAICDKPEFYAGR